ncbi:MAG: DUF3019 domain-containing protein [Halioglobus sp.]
MNFSSAVSPSSSSFILATVLTCLSWGALAAEPVLTARPGVCLLERAEKSPCVMAVELSWNSNGPGDYCLYGSQLSGAIECWTAASIGQKHVELASRENVSFWLQEVPNDEHLAEITIRIVSLSQRKPQRRRRRHVWNVL